MYCLKCTLPLYFIIPSSTLRSCPGVYLSLHVNEWSQFIQRVIVCVIATWHPGGVVEVDVQSESFKVLPWHYWLYSLISKERISGPIVCNWGLPVNPQNHVDASEGTYFLGGRGKPLPVWLVHQAPVCVAYRFVSSGGDSQTYSLHIQATHWLSTQTEDKLCMHLDLPIVWGQCDESFKECSLLQLGEFDV